MRRSFDSFHSLRRTTLYVISHFLQPLKLQFLFIIDLRIFYYTLYKSVT